MGTTSRGRYLGRMGTKIIGKLAFWYTVYQFGEAQIELMNRTIESAPIESTDKSQITRDDMIRGYSIGF